MNTRPVFGVAQRKRMCGMSLIETMVGMTLGILVSLIITQVWGVFEGQKQRTVSATAGQATGLLALTELEQDVRSAGAGLTDSAALNCGTIYSSYEFNSVQISPVPAYSGSMGLAPVQILDGGAGPDTVTVRRSSDFLGAVPATLTSTMPSSSAELNISTTSGFADGDVVLMVSAGGSCTVTQVTSVQVAAVKLQHNPGGSPSVPSYNPQISFQNTNAWPAYVTGDKIMKVGQMISRSYTVNANNEVTVRDDSIPGGSTTSSLAADIVMLKAQYGIAATGSQTVNAWVSPNVASGWSVMTPALLKRIKAVRVVIVARSAKLEAPGTTTVAPVAWPDAASPAIDLSANPDWQRYRYRTYQLVIPIRNVIWANV
jgi:type IV pilus assembly protein PilW